MSVCVRALSKIFFFLFDLMVLFGCTFFFAPHVIVLIYHVPFWRKNLAMPLFAASLLTVLIALCLLRLSQALLRKRHRAAARLVELIFFGLFAVSGFVSCFFMCRLVYFQMSYPKLLTVLLLIGATVMALILPLQRAYRRVLFLLCFVILLTAFLARINRSTVEEADLLPLNVPGIRVVHSLPAVSGVDGEETGIRRRAGMLISKRRFLYLSTNPAEDALFVGDIDFGTHAGKLLKIDIDDGRVIAEYEKKDAYFRDSLYLDETDELVAAMWEIKVDELCFFRASDLKSLSTLHLGVHQVQNVVEPVSGSLLVTSELGWAGILDAKHNVVDERRLPCFPQEVDLDRQDGILAVASLAGYTLITLDTETLEIRRKRAASLVSWGVAVDKGGRPDLRVPSFLW